MFLENLKLAFKNMKKSKMRTFLSLLGIVIGVASVVAIMDLGQSVKGSITGTMNLTGSDILTLNTYSGSNVFDEKLTYSILQNVPEIENATPRVRTSVQTGNGEEYHQSSLIGGSSRYPEVLDLELSYGRFFTEEENLTHRQVAVIGYDVAKALYPAGDAVGKYISIFKNNNTIKFMIIGVLENSEDSLLSNNNNIVLIPLNTYSEKINKINNINEYALKIKEGEDVKTAKASTENYLNTFSSSNDYNISSVTEISNMADTVIGYLTTFLAVIAAISLIVGGIGIMNIMLVTVVERTREIGIRKALGATPKVIKHQFLVEAVVLSLLGGLIGIALGTLICYIVGKIIGWTIVYSLWATLLSLVFSSFVGIFFGLYPAAKAAALDPIDALSYE